MKRSPKYLAAAVLVQLLTITTFATAAIRNVPASYPTIQASIDAASNGDIVIVAPGTYTGNGNRDIDFKGKAITVRGNPADPNQVVIDCQGTQEEPHRGFVFQSSEAETSVLQGVTIINGYGHLCDSWYYSARAGGGIFLSGASPMIEKCVISQCRAKYGGAIYGKDSFPIIRDCVITENSACESYPSNGGGIYGCSGQIENCIISNNSSDVDGGAISYYKGTIANCIINGNISIQSGGAMYGCSGTITNSVIAGNSTKYSGGSLARCYGEITNCTIYRNSAQNGGGFFLYSGKVTNCIIWGNSVEQLHGDTNITNSCIEDWQIHNDSNIAVDPLFVDVSSENPADWDLHLQVGSNCIDVGQNDPMGGLPEHDMDGYDRVIDGDADGISIVDIGAFEHPQNNQPVIQLNNTKFVFYINPENSNTDSHILTISNGGSDVLQWELIETCDWLALSSTSDNSYHNGVSVTMEVDATNLPFGKRDCLIQVVADEAANTPQTVSIVLFVARTLWVPSQYTNIQAAIDAANDSDIIMLEDGTYTGPGNRDIDFKGKAISLRSENGPDNCIIDCQGTREEPHRGFIFQNNENCRSVIDGLTITNGYAYGGYTENKGAAIYCTSGGPTIMNCFVNFNTAEADGGGIYGCKGPILNCVISQNTANGGAGLSWCSGLIANCTIVGNEGGGATGCHGLIYACIFSENSALVGGAISGCNGSIVNCVISNNLARSGAGIESCSGPITNCIISGNSAEYEFGGDGGGLAYSQNIHNCTIVGNYAKANGSAFYICTEISNCIIQQNKPADQFYESETPTHSCIQDDTSQGTGNINADPLFVNPGYWDDNGSPEDSADDFWVHGDYHLKSQGWRWDAVGGGWKWDNETSRCIDAGNPGMALGDEPVTVEVDPLNRFGINKRINMGAYGGTTEASIPPMGFALLADITNDGTVDTGDLATLMQGWLASEQYNPADFSRDGQIDIADFALLASDWLMQTKWFVP